MTIELANRLIELRKEKGLSQEELANKLNISRQAISKWERGESSPDTDNLIELAKIYNISLDELLNYKKDEEQNKEAKENKEDNKISKINLINTIVTCIYSLIALIAFILIGIYATNDNIGWKTSWILLLLIPVISSIFEAIKRKRFCDFLYPILITAIYLFVSFLTNLWHPLWVLFLTIPIYYSIFEPIDKSIKKNNNSIES